MISRNLFSKSYQKAIYTLKGFFVSINPVAFWEFSKKFLPKSVENELQLLPIICDNRKISIDIGANYGMYTAECQKYSKECIAFEPLPHLARKLEKGFKNNKVKINNVALSDKIGETEIRMPKYQIGYSTIEPSNSLDEKLKISGKIVKLTVRKNTLDAYKFDNVGFIKIDVEGHEIEVLTGALKTIQYSKPSVLIEIEERHRKGSIENIVKIMNDLNYRVFFYKNNSLYPYSKFKLNLHQNQNDPKGYSRNFLFVKKEILPEIYKFIINE